MNELDEKLAEFLVSQSAKILQCDESDIQWEDDIDEYGFESMKVNQLCVDINQRFSIDINPAVFLEVTTLEALSKHLKKHHYTVVENALL